MGLRDILVLGLVLGSVPFILFRPHLGVLVWAWIGFMNPHRLAFGVAKTFPVAVVAGAVTIVGLVVSGRWRHPPLTKATLALVLFGVWTQVTTLTALNQEEVWVEWDRFTKILLMTFVTLVLMQSASRLRALIWVVVLSLGFYGVKGGFFTLTTGGKYIVWGPVGSFIGGNNEIGMALIMTIPFMRYLLLTSGTFWVRTGLRLATVLSFVAILGTYSRGAFLGLAVLAVLLALKSRHRVALIALMLLVGALALPFMPGTWSERMESIQHYEQDPSAMGRLNAWRFALNLAMDRPVLGGGFRTFTPELFYTYAPNPRDFHDAHSIYFEVLAEQGFVGLTLFVLLLVTSWRACSECRKLAGRDRRLEGYRDLAQMTQVSIAGYAVCGSFLGLAYFDLFYTVVAVAVLARKLVLEEVRRMNRAEALNAESSSTESALALEPAMARPKAW